MDRLSGMLLDMGITPDLKGFECIRSVYRCSWQKKQDTHQ